MQHKVAVTLPFLADWISVVVVSLSLMQKIVSNSDVSRAMEPDKY